MDLLHLDILSLLLLFPYIDIKFVLREFFFIVLSCYAYSLLTSNLHAETIFLYANFSISLHLQSLSLLSCYCVAILNRWPDVYLASNIN